MNVIILALLLSILATPVFALESENEWFIRKIAPMFAPLFNNCGEGMCSLYGFEDIISWEDREDSTIAYWSVTVIVLHPNLNNDQIARRFTYKGRHGESIKVISMSAPFIWTR